MDEIINDLKKIITKIENIDNNEHNKNVINNICNNNRLILNRDTGEITVGTYTEKLTNSELSLMECLVNSNNKFCTFENLCNVIYGYSDSSSKRSLNTIMSRLRKKLKNLIKFKTIHGRGYQIVEVKGYDKR